MNAPGIVLVGPPGSGKSTIGRALTAHYGYRYVDREALLLREFGSREAFLAAKDTALPALHAAVRAWMAEEGPPWVHETTALSEADFVAELRDRGALLTRLLVDCATACSRVSAREAGANFQNDPEAVARIWEFCQEAHDGMAFDFVCDTAEMSAEVIAARLHAALTG